MLSVVISVNVVWGETSNSVTTQTIETTIPSSDDQQQYEISGNYYYYTDYQDLVSQVYDDVYQDIYDQVYSDVSNEFTEADYELIYDDVESKLTDLLSETEIKLYLKELQNSIYDVVEIIEKSVIGVTSYYSAGGAGIGSAVVYKYDPTDDLYYIITNYHVIEDYSKLEVRFSDGSIVTPIVEGYDTEVDIAILSFSGAGIDNITVSTLGDSDELDVSDFVFAAGNPISYDFYNAVTIGIVSGIDRKVDIDRYVDYIQHDAAINGGNSGGPIYNIDGEVVGINVSKLADVDIEGMGFAIPINLVKRIINRIETDNLESNTIMPRLGSSYYVVEDSIEGTKVILEEITVNEILISGLEIELPAGVTDGLILNQLDVDGSVSNRLQTGDLIVSIGGFQITDELSYEDYLYANYYAGDTILIQYYNYDLNNNIYDSEIQSIMITLK